MLAVNTPMTSPRRAANQRATTVAPSTRAVAPLPVPTTTPHSKISCQDRVISGVRATPYAMQPSAMSIVRRSPNRSITAAANGPMRP